MEAIEIIGSAVAGSCVDGPCVATRWLAGDASQIATSLPILEGMEVRATSSLIDWEKVRVYLLFHIGCSDRAEPVGSLILLPNGDHSVALAESVQGRGMGAALIAEGLWDAFAAEGADFAFVPALRYTCAGHAAFSRAAEILVGWGF